MDETGREIHLRHRSGRRGCPKDFTLKSCASSEVYAYQGPQPVYSPDGRFIASAQDFRVVIRELERLSAVEVISCLDKVRRLAWCARSSHLLCCLADRAQIWSTKAREWTCKIDEGQAGVQHCCWSTDGQHLLIVAQAQIRTTIYTLATRTSRVLPGPKYGDKGIAFSPDSLLLALAEVRRTAILAKD